MSDAKKAAPAEDDGAPKKKGKLMLFIIIGVLLVVLIGGVGVFVMMKKSQAAAEGEDGEEPVQHEVKPKKKDKKAADPHAAPPFYKFEKPFTVKLVSEQGDVYIQVEMQLKLLDAHESDRLKQYDPELKHRITLILLSKKSTDVNSAQGIQRLSNEIRDAINNIIEPPPPSKKAKLAATPQEPLDDADPDQPVQAVLFTSFIIQ